ncbi:MAG: flavodoxin [Okeania sp. SIO2H7]|nr:flavodoxin [Okeania sp. SIO2H7]
MQVSVINYKKVEVQFLLEDLKIFQNILKEVRLALEGGGYETRVGVSPRQAGGFFESILQEMKESGDREIQVSLSRLEITVLNNLLSEGCHGINIQNFEAKIGVAKKEAKNLLNLVNRAIKEMDSLREIRRASYLPSSFDSPTRKICRLEADGDQLTFYLRRPPSNIKNKVYVLFRLTIESSELKFSTDSTLLEIFTEQLWDVVNGLEKYLALLEKGEVEHLGQFTLINKPVLQIKAQGIGIASNGEKQTIMNLRLSAFEPRAILKKTVVEVKGAVFLKNLRSFVSSMQQALTELSESNADG